MSVLLQRICWNDDGWIAPSTGRYRSENSYVGDHGFGHEDWNFNTRDAVGGLVYGYIYRDHGSTVSTRGAGPHEVWFWARPGTTAPRVLVGIYHSAEFVPPAEVTQVLRDMDQRGILSRRVAELEGLGLPKEAFAPEASAEGFIHKRLDLTLKVSPTNIEVFDPPLDLVRVLGRGKVPKYHRYQQFVILPPGTTVPRIKRSTAPPPQAPTPGIDRAEEYRRLTPLQDIVVHRREETLRKALDAHFKKQAGSFVVHMEKGHTDMVVEQGAVTCLLELKTCSYTAPKFALRAAVGQLLFYAYHPGAKSPFSGKTAPAFLCAALDIEPEPESVAWAKELRGLLGIELDIMWPTPTGFASSWNWERLIAKA
jgi:hypothetical protein